jgi:uncharacterized protein
MENIHHSPSNTQHPTNPPTGSRWMFDVGCSMWDVPQLPLTILMAVALLILPSGCAFLQPAQNETRYYLLTAATPGGAPTRHRETRTGCVVRLLPIEVADYLQTKDMAVRTGTNEVHFALFHRWAEPLDAGVRRAVAEDLRAAPGIRAVLTDQPAPAQGPTCTVSIRVLACEGVETNHHGSVIFEAAWVITRSQPEPAMLVQGVFRARPAVWRPGDYDQLARRLSQALRNFSRVLSGAIFRQGGIPVSQ